MMPAISVDPCARYTLFAVAMILSILAPVALAMVFRSPHPGPVPKLAHERT